MAVEVLKAGKEESTKLKEGNCAVDKLDLCYASPRILLSPYSMRQINLSRQLHYFFK